MKCADCDADAAYELRWIHGECDPATGHYGQRLSFGQCEAHMAELVRTTDKRYEFKPLTKQAKRQKVSGGQQAWDL